MADLHDLHLSRLVVDGVDHPAVALPDAVTVLAREFLAARRARVVGQSPDAFDNPAQIGLRDRPQLALGGPLDDDVIGARHA
jgi:hypothetical protein